MGTSFLEGVNKNVLGLIPGFTILRFLDNPIFPSFDLSV